jgi:hypothetical protein
MKQRRRIYYTEAQKALMWDRWQKGESLAAIARLFDRGHSSIQGILAESGGIRPAPRRRSPFALTLAEREEVSRGVVAGRSLRAIATSLGRAPSTISREIRRNGGLRGCRSPASDKGAVSYPASQKPESKYGLTTTQPGSLQPWSSLVQWSLGFRSGRCR